LIICDYSLPGFNALQALLRLQDSGLNVPCILVSVTIVEEDAVAIMRAGAGLGFGGLGADMGCGHNLKRLLGFAEPVTVRLRQFPVGQSRRGHDHVRARPYLLGGPIHSQMVAASLSFGRLRAGPRRLAQPGPLERRRTLSAGR